jgi:hypothetical protein
MIHEITISMNLLQIEINRLCFFPILLFAHQTNTNEEEYTHSVNNGLSHKIQLDTKKSTHTLPIQPSRLYYRVGI